jgi:hypothetical protein
LAKDDACSNALAALVTVVYMADVPTKMAVILSSATLVVLLKMDAADMEGMKRRLGPAYVQTRRPIAMGMAIVNKVECTYALLLLKEAMGSAIEPSSRSRRR